MKKVQAVLCVLLGSCAIVPLDAFGMEIEKKLAICAVLPGDLDRLSCFDKIAESQGLKGPQQVTASLSTKGKWSSQISKNPIDDTETTVIALEADAGKSKWGEAVRFIARCKSNRTEAYIVWNDFLGDDSSSVYEDWKRVTIRIGENKSKVQRWSISTDSKATFAPDWAGNLLKEMITANKLIAQVTPYGESPVTAIFDTTGMVEVLIPLAKNCGWELPE